MVTTLEEGEPPCEGFLGRVLHRVFQDLGASFPTAHRPRKARSNGRYRTQLDSYLAALDSRLLSLHENSGLSLTKFRQEVRRHGVCLATGTPCGSHGALLRMLRRQRDLQVPKAAAKKYKHVKMCLIVC